MAESEESLGLDVTIGDDSHHGRHEDRNNSLTGIEQADLRSKSRLGQIGAHRSQIGSPHGILQEIH